jgi:hypothetical protein
MGKFGNLQGSSEAGYLHYIFFANALARLLLLANSGVEIDYIGHVQFFKSLYETINETPCDDGAYAQCRLKREGSCDAFAISLYDCMNSYDSHFQYPALVSMLASIMSSIACLAYMLKASCTPSTDGFIQRPPQEKIRSVLRSSLVFVVLGLVDLESNDPLTAFNVGFTAYYFFLCLAEQVLSGAVNASRAMCSRVARLYALSSDEPHLLSYQDKQQRLKLLQSECERESNAAALKIQSVWRGYTSKKNQNEANPMATLIRPPKSPWRRPFNA